MIDALRKGIKHGPSPSTVLRHATPGNKAAEERYAANVFSVTRQLRYSKVERPALDMGIFINGLPIATFEFKNRLTKQTVEDAVQQYKSDRDPKSCCSSSAAVWSTLRSMIKKVRMCTHLRNGTIRGSCRSTKAGTMARATRQIPTVSRPIISGKRCSTQGQPDRHPRKLCPGSRGERREDRQKKATSKFSPLPPTERRAQAAGRCRARGPVGDT